MFQNLHISIYSYFVSYINRLILQNSITHAIMRKYLIVTLFYKDVTFSLVKKFIYDLPNIFKSTLVKRYANIM